MAHGLVTTWPPVLPDGTPIPANAHVITGSLVVPADVAAEDQAGMEARFRAKLWPATEHGYRRLWRQFRWAEGGMVLHFRIVDVPALVWAKKGG